MTQAFGTVIWWCHTLFTAWWIWLCVTRGSERQGRFLVMLYGSFIYLAFAIYSRIFSSFSPYHLLWLDPVVFYVTPFLYAKRWGYLNLNLSYSPPALPTLLLITGVPVFLLTKFPRFFNPSVILALAVGLTVLFLTVGAL